MNGKIIEKIVTEHKMCVLISLQLLSETFLILTRTLNKILPLMYVDLLVKYPFFLSGFRKK